MAVTAQYVTLVLDEADLSGSLITYGAASITTSQRLPDPADEMIVGTAPVVRLFRPGSSPRVILIANDSIGPQQDDGDPGWSYMITYSPDTPGAPAPWSFWVPSAGGPVQRLSQLAGTPVVQPGSVAVSSVNGKHGAVVLTAADTGADTAGAAAAAQAAAIAASDPAGSAASAQSAAEAYAAAQASAARSAAIAASDPAGSAAAAAAASLPVSQSFALANNTYKPVYEWTVTGQTLDPLPSFGLVAGSQTYGWSTGGETTQGPAFWFGVNPRHLSSMVPNSPHAALGISAFQSAGDSWNPATGATALEFNIAWVSPTSGKGVAPLEIVGLDDETRTVTTGIRCGDGRFLTHDGTWYVSNISLTDPVNFYMTMGPFGNVTTDGPGITTGQPLAMSNLSYLFGTSPGAMRAQFTAQGAAGAGALTWTAISNNDSMTAVWQGATSAQSTVLTVAGPATSAVTSAAGPATSSVTAAGTNNFATFQANSAAGTSQFILNGNSGVSAQMVWQKNGANTWLMEDSGGTNFLLTNNTGNVQLFMTSGANTAGNYDNATTFLLSKVVVGGSMVVNNNGTALATTATKGFLYIPTCAGTPTGTPVANVGSVPLCYDTVNNQLNVYRGAAWHAITI